MLQYFYILPFFHDWLYIPISILCSDKLFSIRRICLICFPYSFSKVYRGIHEIENHQVETQLEEKTIKKFYCTSTYVRLLFYTKTKSKGLIVKKLVNNRKLKKKTEIQRQIFLNKYRLYLFIFLD